MQAALDPRTAQPVDLPFFNQFLIFYSEMELGYISPPLIRCKLQNSKILKNPITLIGTYFYMALKCMLTWHGVKFLRLQIYGVLILQTE